MNARLLVPLAALVLAAACAPRRIPGTQIDDTGDNHALIEVMGKYRTAVEARDTAALINLASPQFSDQGGTSDPDDDVEYGTLQKELRDRFSRIDNVKLDIDVRSIAVQGDRAEAVYYYTLRYDMPGLSTARQSASDLKKMSFVRSDGQWKITSGI